LLARTNMLNYFVNMSKYGLCGKLTPHRENGRNSSTSWHEPWTGLVNSPGA